MEDGGSGRRAGDEAEGRPRVFCRAAPARSCTMARQDRAEARMLPVVAFLNLGAAKGGMSRQKS